MTHHKTTKWNVKLTRKTEFQYEKLKRSGSKPSVTDVFDFLVVEIKLEGPYRSNWPNYSPLEKDEFHCHLKKKGKPTYVACWRIVDNKNKKIEVYYVGTRENAPY